MAVLYGATVLAQNESAHVNDGAFTFVKTCKVN